VSSPAYACVVSVENASVIASEAGKNFDRSSLVPWLEKHKSGYFIRDESDPLDCHLLETTEFMKIYIFESGDTGALFRRIIKI
jgi:hypothetical protein